MDEEKKSTETSLTNKEIEKQSLEEKQAEIARQHLEEIETKAKQIERETEKPEKNFLTDAKERINNLMGKQDQVEENLNNRIQKSFEKLDVDKGEAILDKYVQKIDDINEDIDKKVTGLEKEFPDKLKPVAYFDQKVAIEAKGFKKISQTLLQQEQEIHEELKKESEYDIFKDKYEKERSE
jgi:hypothetical protein